jgi:Tol biopolymer transport system component
MLRDLETSRLRSFVTHRLLAIVGLFVVVPLVLCADPQGRTGIGRQAMRSVVPPEDTVFSTAGKWLDVSPDGRWLVFSAVRANGQSVLWLRALDSTMARPIVGTEGGFSPFWSPDSRFLGFFAGGQLKKIDVFGGAPQVLCEGGGGFGGSWNRHGVILFSTKTSLERISVGGGSATAVTRLDTEREEIAHTWPVFLPDGRHFLYRIRSSSDAYTGIYVGSIDAPSQRVRLVSADSNPMYVTGYLLFGRAGTLFAQAFDPLRARLIGEPLPVAEQVVQNGESGHVSAAVSASGLLVYRAADLQQLTWLDRRGRELGPLGPAGVYRDPSLSPNGDRVAVSRLDSLTGTEAIWIIDAVRETAARLTVNAARDTSPVFSSDGRHIAFSSNRGGNGWHLYQKTLDGSQAEERLPDAIGSTPTDWSRDGRFLVFESLAPGAKRNLSVLPLTGDRKPFVILHKAKRGQLSPDGRWMAYESGETGMVETYVCSFPAGNGKWQISQGGGTEPKWRGDGQELFYLAPDGTLASVGVRTTSEFAADPPHTLFKTALIGGPTGVFGRNRYDVTADGEWFLLLYPIGGPASSALTVVTNWTSTLRR